MKPAWTALKVSEDGVTVSLAGAAGGAPAKHPLLMSPTVIAAKPSPIRTALPARIASPRWSPDLGDRHLWCCIGGLARVP
jgi:hypothetical protein